MSVLVIVAHPDDESFFMGGTITKLTQAGERVQVVALADGVGSRFRRYQWWQRALARAERADAFRSACRAIGAEGEIVRAFADQRADALQQLDLNRKVEAILRRVRPYVVYTHFLGDGNKDHRLVAEAVMIATRPGCESGKYVRSVYSIAPEYVERAVSPWRPTCAEDLNKEAMRAKLYACCCYAQELRPDPHPRSINKLSMIKRESFREIR